MKTKEQIAIENFLAEAKRHAQPGDIVSVCVFADENSFHRLRPLDELSFAEHCALVEKTIIALTAAGFRASRVVLDEKEYRKWLGEDLNTEMERAKFIKEKTQKSLS